WWDTLPERVEPQRPDIMPVLAFPVVIVEPNTEHRSLSGALLSLLECFYGSFHDAIHEVWLMLISRSNECLTPPIQILGILRRCVRVMESMLSGKVGVFGVSYFIHYQRVRAKHRHPSLHMCIYHYGKDSEGHDAAPTTLGFGSNHWGSLASAA